MSTSKPAARLSHAMVIERLGDMTIVARALGVAKPNTVAHWKKPHRGIPPLYWPAIERLAQAQGLRIRCSDLEAMSPHPYLADRLPLRKPERLRPRREA